MLKQGNKPLKSTRSRSNSTESIVQAKRHTNQLSNIVICIFDPGFVQWIIHITCMMFNCLFNRLCDWTRKSGEGCLGEKKGIFLEQRACVLRKKVRRWRNEIKQRSVLWSRRRWLFRMHPFAWYLSKEIEEKAACSSHRRVLYLIMFWQMTTRATRMHTRRALLQCRAAPLIN